MILSAFAIILSMNNNKVIISKIWDVIVIGGGPSGMMAAGRAGELGKSVLLLEKNPLLGKKLLTTGGGRCNLANYKPDMKKFISMFRDEPKALYSILTQFGIEDTIEFFNYRGMQTKVEAEDRVFPVSNDANSVLQVLIDYLKSCDVKIKTKASVIDIENNKSDKLITVKTDVGVETAKTCVIATGGISHPKTGSTGDGFKWLQKLGHTIHKNDLSLVPLSLYDKWVTDLAGTVLQDVKISIVQNNKRIESKVGKVLFTHVGVSGPTILNMSSKVRDLLENDKVIIQLDLLPDLDHGQLKIEIQNLLARDSNKKIKNTLSILIPSSLVRVILELSEIESDTPNHSVTKESRARLLHIIKALPLNVKGLLGADKAIVSSGGVDIDEVDFKTMASKIVPNIFITGDLLNIDRPSGGYSLQICWSSGFVAGSSC